MWAVLWVRPIGDAYLVNLHGVEMWVICSDCSWRCFVTRGVVVVAITADMDADVNLPDISRGPSCVGSCFNEDLGTRPAAVIINSLSGAVARLFFRVVARSLLELLGKV